MVMELSTLILWREKIMPDKLLRLPKVLELVGIKKTKLWEMIKKGKFPRQRKLGTKTSVWSFLEIQQWIEGVKNGEEIND